MEIKNKKTFEKKFREAVPNFDANKIWFEYKKYETNICFNLHGKLRKLKTFKDEKYIEIWKNYFIEFLETGNFDYNGYWKVYKNRGEFVDDIVYKFPMRESEYSFFDIHTPEFSKFMSDYRYEHGDSGFAQVPKPTIENKLKIDNNKYHFFESKGKDLISVINISLSSIFDHYLLDLIFNSYKEQTENLSKEEIKEYSLRKYKEELDNGFSGKIFKSNNEGNLEEINIEVLIEPFTDYVYYKLLKNE